MYKAENIYSFKVIDEIASGTEVYIVDKVTNYICRANSLEAETLISITRYAEKQKDNRYEFYKSVKVEEENE